MINFPTRIPDCCDSHGSTLLDLFLLMLVFVSRKFSCHWKILIMLLSQFPNGDVPFHRTAYGYIRADWDGHLRKFTLQDVFELGVFATGTGFCEWVHARIDVYIPHRKHLFKHLVLLLWVIEITYFV